ncbi:hypothetical protein J6590_026399 [Homalodisca vitripennis]|nr:hypothetical protein J6590_026399 [Homalodisca vitripennis]
MTKKRGNFASLGGVRNEGGRNGAGPHPSIKGVIIKARAAHSSRLMPAIKEIICASNRCREATHHASEVRPARLGTAD